MPEVPAMQKFAKAGRNEDPNAPPSVEKKPDEKIPQKIDEKPKQPEKAPQKDPEQPAEEEKPKEDILASLMKIIEDPELRELIQKIIDEDKKPEDVPVQNNFVGAGPKRANFSDPFEEREQ